MIKSKIINLIGKFLYNLRKFEKLSWKIFKYVKKILIKIKENLTKFVYKFIFKQTLQEN